MTHIQLWNDDVCQLEVDAIVSPATPSLWMSSGVAEALKATAGEAGRARGGQQLPVSIGDAVVTPAGRLAARLLIHAVSLDRERRTNGAAIESAIRSVFDRAREHEVRTPAMPALGSAVGGFPLDANARITVATIRDELLRSSGIERVVLAMRGIGVYTAFERALTAPVGIDVVSRPAAPLGIDIVPDPLPEARLGADTEMRA